MKDAMNNLLYADDLVLVANGKQELHETLLVTRHGLKLSLEKTEVLHIGHQRLTQGDSFVYLGGVLCGDGSTSKSTGRSERVPWRAVEWVHDVGPAELQKTKGHEHLCDTGTERKPWQ